MKVPRPPLAIAAPALAWLCLETWRCVQAFSPPHILRWVMVAGLVVAVLHERPMALALWMLCSLLGALLWFAEAFGQASAGDTTLYIALAICALANTGYLFFFHRTPAGMVERS